MSIEQTFIDHSIIDTATIALNQDAVSANQPVRLSQMQAAISASDPLFAVSDAIYSNSGAAASTLGTTNYTVGQVVFAFDIVGSFVANTLYRVTAAGTIGTAIFSPLNIANGTIILVTINLFHPTDQTKSLFANQQYKFDNTLVGFAQWVDIGSRTKDADYTIGVDVPVNTSGTYNFDDYVGVGTEIQEIEILTVTAVNGTTGTGTITVGDASSNSKVLQASDIVFGANNLQSFAAGTARKISPLDQQNGKKIVFSGRDQLAVYVTAPTNATTGLMQFRIHCKA